MGETYLALDMSQQQLTPINMAMFEFMLDVSASMLDLDSAEAGGQIRRLALRIQSSPGFFLARQVLRAPL